MVRSPGARRRLERFSRACFVVVAVSSEEERLDGYVCQCLGSGRGPPSWNPWVVSHFPRAAYFADAYDLARARIALARAAIVVARARGKLEGLVLPVDPCDPPRRIGLARDGSRWALVSVGPRGHTRHGPRGPIRLPGP